MDTINTILFIALMLLMIVEIIQYRAYVIAAEKFLKAAKAYEESFSDMATLVKIHANEIGTMSEHTKDIIDHYNQLESVVNVHSETLNLKLLQGILTKLDTE